MLLLFFLFLLLFLLLLLLLLLLAVAVAEVVHRNKDIKNKKKTKRTIIQPSHSPPLANCFHNLEYPVSRAPPEKASKGQRFGGHLKTRKHFFSPTLAPKAIQKLPENRQKTARNRHPATYDISGGFLVDLGSPIRLRRRPETSLFAYSGARDHQLTARKPPENRQKPPLSY